jgi:GNAT superfamily N-acetyltransferase
LLALDHDDQAVGFIALDELDDEPYVAQLSVRLASMRRGIGTQLLNAATDLLRDQQQRSLWLTTYRHLSWNEPFYARQGFVTVARQECGKQLRCVSDYERRWLPMPQQRIVMRKQIDASG